MLDFLVKFPDLLHSAIVFGTVIMFGALGEIITEKSGNLNLGVPGIMYFGGIAGLTSTFMYENVYCANAGIEPNAALCVIMCLVASFLASALGGLIYSFLTISLRTNQNVTGLTLTILGSGVGNFFGGSLNKLAGGVGQVSVAVTSQAFRNYSYSLVNFFDGFTGKLRLGTLLFSYGFLTYVALILAVAIWYFLSKTRTGLSLRAVGENTATADAAGINVTKYKYLATCIGAGISRPRRHVLRHELHQGHLGEPGHHRSARLAGRRPRHLRNVEVAARDLGLVPLRRPLLGVQLHPGPVPQHAGAVQDAPVCGDDHRSAHGLHAQEEGRSAAPVPRHPVFPRGTLTDEKHRRTAEQCAGFSVFMLPPAAGPDRRPACSSDRNFSA